MKRWQDSDIEGWEEFSGNDILKISQEIINQHPIVRVYKSYHPLTKLKYAGRIISISNNFLEVELLERPRSALELSKQGPARSKRQRKRRKHSKKIRINQKLKIEIPSEYLKERN